MISKFSMTAAACVLALTTMTGCANRPTNAQIGTAAGAVVGGVAGNVLLGGPLATIGGAAAGALIGNEVGKKR
ncbi:glycine zipper 2TM domain-containing protein [Polaromonas sp. YR568]|uniref:glycine zipper 2TM domain-containing protein n=1 Tax=Polaromonas sp. YR568 TaxID=1855301 RepID=UPI000AD05DB1|nr:glycine zipper 2TM domain-containing protein [Polaromonas sp. YR568]